MRLELTGRHTEITPVLRRLVGTKLAKLERMLNDGAISAQAVLTREKHRHMAEITLHARGEKFLHGIGSAPNWEASVGQAIDKLAQQALKVKGKWRSRKRRGTVKGEPIVGESREAVAVQPRPEPAARPVRARMPRILRASRQTVVAMSVAEAAREVDTRGGLIVFRDSEREAVSVIYRQGNGELALVVAEL
jgi:putative sigma-54 modulation protein